MSKELDGATNISKAAIELSDADAEKFRLFCQYYEQFSHLLVTGVFDRVRPGKVVLHLDPAGQIGKIELHPMITVIVQTP